MLIRAILLRSACDFTVESTRSFEQMGYMPPTTDAGPNSSGAKLRQHSNTTHDHILHLRQEPAGLLSGIVGFENTCTAKSSVRSVALFPSR